MGPAPSPSVSRWLRPSLLALTALFLWTMVTGRWSALDWTAPEDFGGDPLEIYARAAIAADDPLAPLAGYPRVARLGAPLGADWAGYPVSDGPTFVLAGLLARGIGPFAAVKLLSAVLIAAAALSFYGCARWLRWRPEWAATGALLFAFTNYNLRWAVTLSLGQTWTLPPLVLLCAFAARRTPNPPPRKSPLIGAALLGVWMGCGNPYFVLFGGLIAGGAIVLNRLRHSAGRRLRPLAVYLAAMGAAAVVSHLPYVRSSDDTEQAHAQFHRGSAGADVYALKPLDLAIPPGEHRIEPLAAIGRRYAADSVLQGEFFYNYLGVFGIVGLVWLLARAVQRVAVPDRRRPVPDAAIAALACGCFSAVGGGNALLALTGVDWFRASGRIAVLLALWALFFFFSELHRRTIGRSRRFTIVVASIIGVVGLWEEVPLLDSSAVRPAVAEQMAADRLAAAKLEQTVGPSALVFQLPALPFPEAGKQNQLGDYEHFRPYFASATLRFSYGTMRGMAAARWTDRVASLPSGEMVAELARAGFSALWIDRRGFADSAAALLARLRQAHLPEIDTARSPDVVVFRLTPEIATPLARDDPRLTEPWDAAAPAANGNTPTLHAVAGWFPCERADGRVWRWAGRTAVLGIHCPDSTRELTLQFRVGSLGPGRLELREGDAVRWSQDLRGGPPAPVTVRFAAAPGSHRLGFAFSGQPVRPSANDPRQLGFVIENLTVVP